MKSRRTLIVLLAVSFCLSMLVVPQAHANPDVYHLQCASPTICQSSNGLFVTGTSSVTFNIINTSNGSTPLSGSAFVVIAVPTGGGVPTGSGSLVQSVSFTSGSIWTALGLTGNGTDYNIGTFQNDSQQVNVSANNGYTLYEFSVGSFTNCSSGTCIGGLSYSNLPAGSVIVSFLEDSSGNVIDQNPNSDSITSSPGVVPEPGSIALFGSGLVFLGGFLRRYRWS